MNAIPPTHASNRLCGISRVGLAAAVLAITLLPSGCKKTVDDATLTKNVQSALAADTVIGNQPIQVATQTGVVTLSGNVSDDTARSLAASDAAKVEGVKEVANSLTVAGMAVTPTITTPAAPTVQRTVTPTEQTAIENHQALPPPPPASAAPPPPPVHTVTVAAGRDVSIRITQSFDSETAQPGTPFSGVVTRPIVGGGYIAIPTGASIRGTVTDAKDATHFKGSSLLVLRLEGIRHEGQWVQVSADPYVLQGKGRGKNTAAKIGGGAAIGAVLGGIFGGGKGAAIGAGVGGGGGAAVQGMTRGQQVHIASESVIPFRLTNSFTVQTSRVAGSDENNAPGLQTREP
ncbi:BON domain-containing protein [Granulicella sp. 5B5]|uniref:BON domain-containing protein n=1 Tax=Granulicella sp. 5B5 TaxID=1617967 RepID=UPI0015F705A7|nr:BON domain-containing protein [Granulicella sp. 5B5]QMV19640.1 BON domain-containing protein [Granulicella sp. 5B5]